METAAADIREAAKNLLQNASESASQSTSKQSSTPCQSRGRLRNPPDGYENLDESRVDQDLIAKMRAGFADKAFPIYLSGTVGLGKSFAAAMVYTRWQGPSVTFLSYADLIGLSIRADRDGSISRMVGNGQMVDLTAAQWWKWLTDVSLLIVDEIGTGMAHEWRREMLWKVLEIRKGKPLLITGNLSSKGLTEQFDARIQSRIMAGTFIELVGSDKRLEGLRGRVHRIEVK